MIQAVKVLEKFDGIQDFWSPRVLGEVNDQYIKIAKLKGDLVWHTHDDEDELFYVVKGSLVIEMETGVVRINEGEFFVVPKDVRHNPIAEQECWVLLVETKSTKHTGDEITDKTKNIEDQL
jgi:mannose-6-phosphate isomerase-like protein (cupin superfamily)